MTSFNRAIIVLALIATLTIAVVWGLNRVVPPTDQQPSPLPNSNGTNILSNNVTASPSITPTENENPAPVPAQETPRALGPLENSYVGTLKLIIPVLGVRRDELLDTFSDARSEARVHDAIDIPAPANTPVLAAADGQIVKLFQSERGGTTIYQASSDKKLIFYYAHLSGYAAGIEPGKQVRQGETIAYVGDTGNAGVGNFHLHFSIAIVADPNRYWEGTNINPYPLLHR